MPLKLVKRGAVWYVRGTVRGRYCFETAGTSERSQAEAYRAKREAQLYEASIFGERAAISFGRAALNYLDFETRSERTKDYVAQLIAHFGERIVGAIDQAAADEAVESITGLDAAASTKVRIVYTPLTAILTHAAKRGWCAYPHFDKPEPPPGSTRWLAPLEALALIEGAAPHLRPMLSFFFGAGARVAEALDLEWTDLHLVDAKARLRNTKNGFDRIAHLPPVTVAALAELPHREGKVFRRDDGESYADRERLEGGQIKTAFATACRNAGLLRPVLNEKGEPMLGDDGEPLLIPSVTPHDCRHTWATWFYGVTKDLLLLKDEGGWRTLAMVERYAHLMPSELVPQIGRVWGPSHPRIGPLPVEAPQERKGAARA